MSKFRAFTQQSREEILRSLTNQSTSKQAWTFSKGKRFAMNPANCPYITYNPNPSTLSNRKTSFGSSRRKVFTETSEGPSSWVYRPSEKMRSTTMSFGPGREEAIANCYIERDPLKFPGPGRYNYNNRTIGGYTMRPKTANHRNYKEMAMVPGPGNYEDLTSKISSKAMVSRFKSTVLGSSMYNKTKRFAINSAKTPSPWEYNKNNLNLLGRDSTSSRIGSENRKAFTDTIAKNSFTPGPGNYKVPTEFAHYKKI